MDPASKAAGEINNIFTRVGIPCEVCVTEAEGKHVKTTVDMEEGHAVVEELPIVSWPSTSLLHLDIPFCFHCLRLSTHRRPAEPSSSSALPPTPSVVDLPDPWKGCERCGSCFCSAACQQASARVHRLLCAGLWTLRGGRRGDAGDVTAAGAASPLVAPPSAEIPLEALARCVGWVTHRLSLQIEQQALSHEMLQMDYLQQQQLRGGEGGHGSVWSATSLTYQLFTNAVNPFSRLLSPPLHAEFEGISLPSWIATLRSLLVDRCVTVLLCASGAPLAAIQRHPLQFDDVSEKKADQEEQGMTSGRPPSAAPVEKLLWAEALMEVLFSDETLRTLVGQMALNAHAIHDYVLPTSSPAAAPSTGAFDWILKGAGLYTLLACFNHSCDPNTAVNNVDETHEVVIKTLRPIAAGEPLTITYIPLGDGSSSSAERQRLLKRYFFTCRCTRCVGEQQC